ncbi:MAG: hotdog domain-containing protein, partial [Bacillales bacterium]|nr:hotdog domain-containing protein [Bacillales bacterium]
NMSHLAPTKIGDEVIVTCSLVAVEKRILTFELEARDSNNVISKATHQRCIVNVEKFMAKLR